ncbi:unnamed protein product [Brassica napus]|uniref:(rape) hypothetical protein n=1 Tax=Brassica napus TaxID=3708 RepID=A0A816N8T7_BRANA|nr:unnamed protein product [Brassica napus]
MRPTREKNSYILRNTEAKAVQKENAAADWIPIISRHSQLCRLGKLQNREGVRSFSLLSFFFFGGSPVEVRRFPSSYSFSISERAYLKKMAEDGIIQPPEDIATKTIVEKTASFLSRNKMDKSEIMPSDVRYNFLRSKTDPSHAYYSYMLSKYSDAHSQGGGGAVEGAAVNIEPDDHTKDLTIINTPAQVPAITLAARVACLVSVEGLDLEKQLRDSQVSDTRFNFLRDASDVCHAYYQRSLAYLSFGNKSQLKARAQPPPVFNTPNTQILWHPFYNEFQRAYERLFKPPKDTKEQLYKSAEYTDAIQKGFLQRIQLDDPIKERKWLEQGERAMIDWHDATSKPFAMKEVQELLPPQGPDPKRQKLEVSLLVPETQFLAQHQGLSSLTVSFPNRQAVVIKRCPRCPQMLHR